MIFRRFSQEIRDRRPVWDFGCGIGQTSQYLKNLGIEISGLDLSEKILEQARRLHPEIHFRLDEFLDKKVDIDFTFFTTDFIFGCLEDSGFKKIDVIEREPYPGVEYESRRAYVFAIKLGVREK